MSAAIRSRSAEVSVRQLNCSRHLIAQHRCQLSISTFNNQLLSKAEVTPSLHRRTIISQRNHSS